MRLSISEKILILLNRKDTSKTDLAKATGQTRQNLCNKLRRDDFKYSELTALAEALDCRFEGKFYFIDENGKEIEL